ncbi:MAG: short-chain dehydrogenase [Hydrogenothermus sp.]|nr:MAG: short-chain dehydrogenase [Hydrogenothermus sp.]
MEIKGKNILITGSAKRIGKYLALNLAKEGANIVIHYKASEKEAKKLEEYIKNFGVDAISIKANLEKEDDVKKLAYESLNYFKKIDILINNASIYYPTPIFEENLDDLDRFYKVHIKAPFILSKIIGKNMLENKTGRIINIVDYSPLRPYKDFTPYIVSKGGLLTLTKSLAKELAPYVLVNAVLPGPIVPPEDTKDIETPLKKTLLKRWAGEKEVFKAVKYLIETDFTTGAFIPVEGGRLQC